MDAERVRHHEDNPDQRGEQDVDAGRDQLLTVGPALLKPAERFAAALILEDRVGQLQRVPDAVGVQLRAEPLRDDVDVVILKVLRDARHERDANRCAQQQADASEELTGRIFLEPGRVLVDDMTEDERVEQREHLVDRGEREGERDQAPVVPEIRVEEFHGSRNDYMCARSPRARVCPSCARARSGSRDSADRSSRES